MQIDIDKIGELIRANLSDDLLTPERRRLKALKIARGEDVHPTFSHCFVASETLWQILGGSKSDYKLMFVKHEGDNHWYVASPSGEPIDLTVEQFETQPNYDEGKRKGPPTPIKGSPPSKRARILMNRIGYPVAATR